MYNFRCNKSAIFETWCNKNQIVPSVGMQFQLIGEGVMKVTDVYYCESRDTFFISVEPYV